MAGVCHIRASQFEHWQGAGFILHIWWRQLKHWQEIYVLSLFTWIAAHVFTNLASQFHRRRVTRPSF